MKTILLMLAVFSFSATAQTAATPDAPTEPQFALGVGLGFNHYDTPQFKGELSFATHVATGTYSISTLNTTSKVSTLVTGVSKQIFHGQGFTLAGLVDGGIATGQGNVGGTVSGGGLLTFDISKPTKIPGAFLYGAVRIVQNTLTGLQPAFSIGFGKSF